MRSKKALINIISSLILQIITIICGFIIPKIIISVYGSDVNGLLVSITQFLSFITLLEAGFGPVIKSILYKPISDKDRIEVSKILKASEKIFKIISYIFVVYIIFLCILLPLILANEFDSWFTISIIVIISISTFAEYYFGMTYKLFLQAEQKSYIVNIIQVSTLILNTIIILLLIYFRVNIQVVKLVSSIIFVLRPILQNRYVKKKYNINLKDSDSDYKIEQKWEGLAQHIAYVIHKNADVVILTLFGNLAEISVYSIYLMIINSMKNIVQSFAGGIDAAFGNMLAKGEEEELNGGFKIYEGVYFTVATILFSSMLFLIIPFVEIYTKGITDVNYIRPVFSILMVMAEFICVIRQPYNDLVKVAGHFKQTRIGACVEAFSNALISFILVWHWGIVGVAIGTLFAMFIRTIEFMYYTSKYILKRNVFYTFKRLVVIGIEVTIISIIVNVIPHVNITGYFLWGIQSVIVFIISSIIVISANCFIYKDNVESIIQKAKVIIKK